MSRSPVRGPRPRSPAKIGRPRTLATQGRQRRTRFPRSIAKHHKPRSRWVQSLHRMRATPGSRTSGRFRSGNLAGAAVEVAAEAAVEAAVEVAVAAGEGTNAAPVVPPTNGTLWAASNAVGPNDTPEPTGVRPIARQLSLAVRRVMGVLTIPS